MTDKAALIELAGRVKAMITPDNAIDVRVEVALHRPGGQHEIRANAAGTKVIYTRRADGKQQTFWADEWTANHRRKDTAASLSAIAEGME
jgi:hypothetical protein